MDAIDHRPLVRTLLDNAKANVASLEELADRDPHRYCEDPIYRMYHQSFKVFLLQDTTEEIVGPLEALNSSEGPLNAVFTQIVAEGTGHVFTYDDNRHWLRHTRPVVEAFFHARFFSEMAVKYAKVLDDPPAWMPSGWAALLYLYNYNLP